jgi:hypothetical protein
MQGLDVGNVKVKIKDAVKRDISPFIAVVSTCMSPDVRWGKQCLHARTRVLAAAEEGTCESCIKETS